MTETEQCTDKLSLDTLMQTDYLAVLTAIEELKLGCCYDNLTPEQKVLLEFHINR